jgi:hypothetical protein
LNWVGYAGLILLAVALMIVAFGAVAALPSLLRFRRLSLQTSQLVEMYRQAVDVEIEELADLSVERELLLRPFRRLWRVLTHPFTLAVYESYRLRRRRKAVL